MPQKTEAARAAKNYAPLAMPLFGRIGIFALGDASAALVRAAAVVWLAAWQVSELDGAQFIVVMVMRQCIRRRHRHKGGANGQYGQNSSHSATALKARAKIQKKS